MSKTYTYLMPIFCQKYVHSLKNNVLSCIFFQIFMKNLLHVHIWSKKHQFCQTYTILAKKVNRKPFFFLIFTKKIISLRPYDKKVHCLKNKLLWTHICSKKRPFSQKHSALMSLFSNFHEKPMLSCPYLVRKV